MSEDIPADKLVSVYRRIRAKIEEAEEEHKQFISELKDQMETVSEQLLKLCNDQNVDSLRTVEGTVTRQIKSRFWTTDWESMYKFIKEQDVPFLLERRIHTTNMRQFLDENPDLHPIGLQEDRKYAITVRKPTNK
jgi:hypothetical protein